MLVVTGGGKMTVTTLKEFASTTSSYGLKQLIAEPTHILPTSSSCIDPLFTNQTIWS